MVVLDVDLDIPQIHPPSHAMVMSRLISAVSYCDVFRRYMIPSPIGNVSPLTFLTFRLAPALSLATLLASDHASDSNNPAAVVSYRMDRIPLTRTTITPPGRISTITGLPR